MVNVLLVGVAIGIILGIAYCLIADSMGHHNDL